MIAWLNLRHSVPERTRAVEAGLRAHGYKVRPAADAPTVPGPRDALVSWNRIREGHPLAKRFEGEGRPVFVFENASWGNSFCGQRWYTVALGYHNLKGHFPMRGPERWDSLGVKLEPWRTGGETVILPSRGIGPPAVAMPLDWTRGAYKRHGGRVRNHPGRGPAAVPLQTDLKSAGHVVTWGSGAAILAVMWGIPCTSYLPNWVGGQDNTDAGRLAMLRRLAWAQWTIEEIENGQPFANFGAC